MSELTIVLIKKQTNKQTNKQKNNNNNNKLDFATLQEPGKPIAQNVSDAIKVSVVSHAVISC